MFRETFQNPIEQKIRFWMDYEKNLPQIPYRGNEIFFDEYRSRNDLDCQFLGGNLGADTIFSLWQPLKETLLLLNEEDYLTDTIGEPRKRRFFLQKLLNSGLDPYLPPENPLVAELKTLFLRGQQRENVMLLSNRGLNEMRALPPYDDYMPYFLVECFKGGKFAHIFNHDDGLLRFWLMREELQVFFDEGFLVPDAVLDLSGSGDPRISQVPTGNGQEADETALLEMFQDYNAVLLERRQALFPTEKEITT